MVRERKSMRIFFWSINLQGNGVYRCIYPGNALHRLGHRVKVSTCVAGDSLELPDLNYDVYVFQVPQNQVSLDCVRAARKQGRVCICEMDDYYHAIPAYNPTFFQFSPSQGNKVKIMEQCMRECDAVTVSTPELAELYSGFNPNIFPLPNLMDFEDEDWETPPREHRDEVVIGWAGSPSHDEDFKVMRGCLEQICRKYPEVRVEIGGSRAVFDQLGNIPEDRKSFHPGVKFSEYPKMLARFDIGLVPLVENKFNRCKSDLKGLEYSRLSIPFLASPLPAYRRVVKDGENGFLCGRPRDWTNRLSFLIENPDEREKMGRRAREGLRNKDIAFHAFLWEQLYETVIAMSKAERACVAVEGN